MPSIVALYREICFIASIAGRKISFFIRIVSCEVLLFDLAN